MLSKEIDKIKFKVPVMNVFEANALDRELQELIPTILDAVQAIAPDSGDIMDSDLSALSGGMRKIFEEMGPEKFQTFSVRMLKGTTAEVPTKGIDPETDQVVYNSVNLADADAIGTVGLTVIGLYKLLFVVMEVNGFIPFALVTTGGGTEKILNFLGVTMPTKNSKRRSGK